MMTSSLYFVILIQYSLKWDNGLILRMLAQKVKPYNVGLVTKERSHH